MIFSVTRGSPSGVRIDNWPDVFPGNFVDAEKYNWGFDELSVRKLSVNIKKWLMVYLFSVMKRKCEIVTDKNCNQEPKVRPRSLHYPWQPCIPQERCLTTEERVCHTEYEKVCQPYRRRSRFRRGRSHFRVCRSMIKVLPLGNKIVSTIHLSSLHQRYH